MTTFIVQAARLYLEAADKEYLESDLEPDQVEALRDELSHVNATPVTSQDRAERGRLSVEIFGMRDDVETMAADVIADILHWVNQNGGAQSPGAAYFQAARYYQEERS